MKNTLLNMQVRGRHLDFQISIDRESMVDFLIEEGIVSHERDKALPGALSNPILYQKMMKENLCPYGDLELLMLNQIAISLGVDIHSLWVEEQELYTLGRTLMWGVVKYKEGPIMGQEDYAVLMDRGKMITSECILQVYNHLGILENFNSKNRTYAKN